MNEYRLKGTRTLQNLVNAFAGESQARTRYQIMARTFKKEGLSALSDMINLIAHNEYEHARMIYSFIQAGTDTTLDNLRVDSGYPFKEREDDIVEALKFAAEDEFNEAERIYPEFAKVAGEEGFKDISNFFKNLLQIETCHKLAFTELYDQLKSGTLYKREVPTKWKCSDCGHEATLKEAWTICPVCQASQGKVMLVMKDNAN